MNKLVGRLLAVVSLAAMGLVGCVVGEPETGVDTPANAEAEDEGPGYSTLAGTPITKCDKNEKYCFQCKCCIPIQWNCLNMPPD